MNPYPALQGTLCPSEGERERERGPSLQPRFVGRGQSVESSFMVRGKPTADRKRGSGEFYLFPKPHGGSGVTGAG